MGEGVGVGVVWVELGLVDGSVVPVQGPSWHCSVAIWTFSVVREPLGDYALMYSILYDAWRDACSRVRGLPICSVLNFTYIH